MFTPGPGTLRFDDSPGTARPVGYTCTQPRPIASATVTFNNTAVAFDGTPVAPTIFIVVEEPGRRTPLATPVPSRVSITRSGPTEVNFDEPVGVVEGVGFGTEGAVGVAVAGADGVEMPTPLVAVKRSVYVVPFDRPVTVHDRAGEVHVRPPGLLVTS
jgi:hypothetical protein